MKSRGTCASYRFPRKRLKGRHTMRKKYGGRVVFISSQTFPPNINRRESTNPRQEKFLKNVLNMVADELKTDNFKDKKHKDLCKKIQVQTLKDCQDLSEFESESEASEDLHKLCVDYVNNMASSKQKDTFASSIRHLRNSYLYLIDDRGKRIKNPTHKNVKLGKIYGSALNETTQFPPSKSRKKTPRHMTPPPQMSPGTKMKLNSRAQALINAYT